MKKGQFCKLIKSRHKFINDLQPKEAVKFAKYHCQKKPVLYCK